MKSGKKGISSAWRRLMAERLAVAIESRQRQLADWLNDRCRRLAPGNLKWLLFGFLFVVAVYLASLVIGAFN
ncbi:hypothetical protein [Pedobacter ureilyticus]|uniref:Uncharacterized protein n=1 Tax=Pedobacter ureilyticus TaxID=1393051 RepID=A0ABW9JBV9_9SPHI|nr:hypothetical protein [Pedobacter helvus]